MLKDISEIQNAIEAAHMSLKVAITDRDPLLFARREQELKKLCAENERVATEAVQMAKAELARREKTLAEIKSRSEASLNKLRIDFETVDQRIDNAKSKIHGLQKSLRDSSAIAKLAKLKEQVAALEAALGD